MKIKMFVLPLAAMALFASCEKDGNPGNPGEGTPDGGFQELVPEKPDYINAEFIYHGDDGMGDSDWWELTLCTDMEMVSTSTPVAGTGPGQAICFTLNAKKNEAAEADLSFVAGKYGSQSNSGDFSAGTFVQGYIYSIEIPGGEIEIPDGTYFADFADGSTDYNPDLLREGDFTISVNEDGTCTVEGVLVGTEYLKRYFSYTGTPKVTDKSGENGSDNTPNSSLTGDITLPQFTKARLIDRKDTYTWDQSNRAFALYLAEEGIDLSGEWPSGTGKVMRIEFFVSWDTDVAEGIPAGTYTMAYQYPDGGIPKDEIVPFRIAPGYPDKFQYFTGTWYIDLDGGEWTEYARISGGSVTVGRNGDAHTLSISLEDCSNPAYKVSGSWTTDGPIGL